MDDGKQQLNDQDLDRLLGQASPAPDPEGFTGRLLQRLGPNVTPNNVIAFPQRGRLEARPVPQRIKWQAVAALAACLAFGFVAGNGGFLVNLLGDGTAAAMVASDSESSVDDIAKVIDGDQT